jgi:predicted transcriptional regulator
MAKAKGKRRRQPEPTGEDLPDSELEVLACLWNGGEATAAEIRRRLASQRPMSHGALLSLLNRLSEKGLITRRKSGQGKAFAFRAAYQAAPTYRRLLKKLTERVFNDNPIALVSCLLETYSPDEDDLKQIRQLLEELRQRGRDKGT